MNTTTHKAPKPAQYTNATALHLGGLCSLINYASSMPNSPEPTWGKLWTKELLGLTGMEVSFGVLGPGQDPGFLHIHNQNEELYLIVSGKGQILVDQDSIDVNAGSAVRISPAGVRCWRNTGDKDLVYIVIQARANSLQQWTNTDGKIVEGKPQWQAPTCQDTQCEVH